MGEWVNKTSKGFVGGVASGRGVNITAEDDTVTITADRDLPRAKIDLAIAGGFDDISAAGFTILEGEKRKIRESAGPAHIGNHWKIWSYSGQDE